MKTNQVIVNDAKIIQQVEKKIQNEHIESLKKVQHELKAMLEELQKK